MSETDEAKFLKMMSDGQNSFLRHYSKFVAEVRKLERSKPRTGNEPELA